MPVKLKPIPDSTDFSAPKGASVTLVTRNHIGEVLISKAEYAGKQLVPDGQAVSKLTLNVAADRHTLKLVSVFSASTTGKGELRETDGGDSQFLRDLSGTEPFQIIRIVGV